MRAPKHKQRQCDRPKIASFGKWQLFLVAAALVSAQQQGAHAQQTATAPQTIQQMTLVGQTNIHSTPIGNGALASPEIVNDQGPGSGFAAIQSFAPRANLPIPGKEAARVGLAASTVTSASATKITLPLPEPVVKPRKVAKKQAENFAGFDGLSHIDQRTANGGNQFSIEPPDQGLCAGNDYVMETVNDVIRVFDSDGNPLSAVLDMNSFFGLAAAIDRATGVRGPFLSDPRCFYDAQTRRWFVTELMEDFGGNVGATFRNYNLIAVSQSADPTGEFTVFKYDVTDDGVNGTANHPGCPCFGDQPLFGFDQFGVYQSTNEFGSTVFNGAQIYAISKRALIAAAKSEGPLPVVVHIDASGLLVPFGGLSYSVQPAVAPSANDGNESDSNVWNGVEYFLSALQFGNPGYEVYDNRIAVWALTNTRSLGSHSPSLALSLDVVQGETYGQPDNADQKAGPTPLGTSLGDPLEQVATNDDRMNQVVYVGGLLYGAVNSKLSVAGASQTGVAWFAVSPSFEEGNDKKGTKLKGEIVDQGYIAVARNNVIFPSIALTDSGNGVIAFTLVGPDYFPSAAYVVMGEGGPDSSVHVAGAGLGPEDGFSGYPQFGGAGVARWGDYSAATSDGDGIWFAAEYIPKACTTLSLPCRTSLANWGTFVGSILP